VEYYYIADVELKANKQREYHDYWPKKSMARHAEEGGEQVATFSVISGAESTVRVKRLFKIPDFTKWVKNETHHYHSDKWAELALDVKITILALEPYSDMERFLVKSDPFCKETDPIDFYYCLEDIELKPNKQKEYHENWPKQSMQRYQEASLEHVATFTVISGAETTTHVKRLFRILDLEKWVQNSTNNYHSDSLADLAYGVKLTLLAPEPYSNLK
jgi:hypothetical protein